MLLTGATISRASLRRGRTDRASLRRGRTDYRGHKGSDRGCTNGVQNQNSPNGSTRPRLIVFLKLSRRRSLRPKLQVITQRQVPRREFLPSRSSSLMLRFRARRNKRLFLCFTCVESFVRYRLYRIRILCRCPLLAPSGHALALLRCLLLRVSYASRYGRFYEYAP